MQSLSRSWMLGLEILLPLVVGSFCWIIAYLMWLQIPCMSMFTWLEKDLHGANNKWIWDSKLSLKIKIFFYGSCVEMLFLRAKT